MKLYDFFRSKLIPAGFLTAGSVLLSIMFRCMDISVTEIVFFYIFELIFIIIWFFTDFYITSKKINRLGTLIENTDKKYLAGELLPEPSDPTEVYYYEIMKQMSRAVIAETENAIRSKEEYMNYVDCWIHEIKTPLTAISLILDNNGPASSVRRELKKADNLAETILFYALTRDRGKSTNISEFNVSEALNETVRDQKILLISAGCSVEVSGDFTVNTDKKAFEFIITQLLVNCSKYCKGCKIIISAADNKFTVRDNGPGIPSHEIMKITSKGYTGGLHSENSSSTGMGLYIVSELCRHLDIKLSISSELNEYTEISLTFHNLTKL